MSSVVVRFGNFTMDEAKELMSGRVPEQTRPIWSDEIAAQEEAEARAAREAASRPIALASAEDGNLTPAEMAQVFGSSSKKEKDRLAAALTTTAGGADPADALLDNEPPFRLPTPVEDVRKRLEGSDVAEMLNLAGLDRMGGATRALATTLVPHGLRNSGNLCFMNSVLQALVSCPPFYELLDLLRSAGLKNYCPVFGRLCNLLTTLEEKQEGPRPDVARTTELLDLLVGVKDGHKTRQEDAQEFLSFLIDALHGELLQVRKYLQDVPSGVVATASSGSGGAVEWEEVGKGRKTSKVAHVGEDSAGDDRSPMRSLFWGTFRSTVRRPGKKDSVTMQSFDCVQLEIQDRSVTSLLTGLEFLVRDEKLDVDGMSKQVLFERLPPILIVHVKRFTFSLDGPVKIDKLIAYPCELNLPENFVSTHRRATIRPYHLHAVVSHSGARANQGHYVADVRQPDDSWIHYNDAVVTPATVKDVLSRQAYLLVYILKENGEDAGTEA